MADQEDYYQVLGVSPDASLDEIRRARRSKAMEYHPDRLAGVSEGVRRLAEEELKKINAAYDVLRDPDKRRQYDSEDLRKSPPIPEITPKIIRFDNVEPGRMQRNSFVVRNVGGACSKINIGDTDPWLRITGYKSLTQGDTFPLQVDLEAQGQGFGQTYQQTVTVSLDESKATVRVELSTEVAPQPRASGIGQATSPATPGSTTSTSYQSGQPRCHALFVITKIPDLPPIATAVEPHLDVLRPVPQLLLDRQVLPPERSPLKPEYQAGLF